MISRWYELKPAVLALRQNGKSLSFIEANLGIPRSTLSGWCKEVTIAESQRQRLRANSLEALREGRLLAAKRHRDDKIKRLKDAEDKALQALGSLNFTPSLTKLALAMLYWGEGKKKQTTALGSADPEMLLFFLAAVRIGFGLDRTNLVYELHLRKDQNSNEAITYWSKTLSVPAQNFKRVYFDKRTENTATYPGYHGVCLIYCSDIAIQRELVYLYKSFSQKISGSLGD